MLNFTSNAWFGSLPHDILKVVYTLCSVVNCFQAGKSIRIRLKPQTCCNFIVSRKCAVHPTDHVKHMNHEYSPSPLDLIFCQPVDRYFSTVRFIGTALFTVLNHTIAMINRHEPSLRELQIAIGGVNLFWSPLLVEIHEKYVKYREPIDYLTSGYVILVCNTYVPHGNRLTSIQWRYVDNTHSF